MTSANNAQAVGYVGSSICNLFKLSPYLTDYDMPSVMNVVMTQLNEQIGHRSSISSGQHVGFAADLGTPTVGTAQNSGVSNSLA